MSGFTKTAYRYDTNNTIWHTSLMCDWILADFPCLPHDQQNFWFWFWFW